MPELAAVGAVENANTMILVTVSTTRVLDRRKVELTSGLSTHPYHHEGAWAVGRYLGTPGARKVTLPEAIALVKRVQVAALEGARRALAEVAERVDVPIRALSLRACPELPATIEACLRDNRAQTQADSVMYRRAVEQAATERGWSVTWYTPDTARAAAGKVLGVPSATIDRLVREFGRTLGPPWQAKHVLAAQAALASLGGRRRSSGRSAADD